MGKPHCAPLFCSRTIRDLIIQSRKITKRHKEMEKEHKNEEQEINDFSVDVKRDILDIINDCPSLVRLGDKEYAVQNMRFYSLYRVCKLATDMHKADEKMDDDNTIVTALCTDLDAMCEIVAIILCNHYFTPEGNSATFEEVRSKNDKMISIMKAKVMQSTFDTNQWAAIIIGAIKSIDLSVFFFLKKSVSTLTDSLLARKKNSMETASQFMEALSLQTQPIS